jgi:hypothetical protein
MVRVRCCDGVVVLAHSGNVLERKAIGMEKVVQEMVGAISKVQDAIDRIGEAVALLICDRSRNPFTGKQFEMRDFCAQRVKDGAVWLCVDMSDEVYHKQGQTYLYPRHWLPVAVAVETEYDVGRALTHIWFKLPGNLGKEGHHG